MNKFKINRHVKASFYTTLFLTALAVLIFTPANIMLYILGAVLCVCGLAAVVGLYFAFLDPK